MTASRKQPRINNLFKRFARFIQLPLFDINCRICECPLTFSDESVICRECKSQIKLYPHPTCTVCGRYLTEFHERCGECIITLPPFRKHFFYAPYKDQLRDLILAYKYSGVEKIKNLLVNYYAELFTKKQGEPGVPPADYFDFIIPVPPDKSRKREFDPILEMAKKVSRRLEIRLLSGRLVKVKKTDPQASLSRAKRLVNLDGAFDFKKPELLDGKKILLLDDVFTTGTTIAKCSLLLVNHNAEVTAMTLGRS